MPLSSQSVWIARAMNAMFYLGAEVTSTKPCKVLDRMELVLGTHDYGVG